jgi:hypothetical protein
MVQFLSSLHTGGGVQLQSLFYNVVVRFVVLIVIAIALLVNPPPTAATCNFEGFLQCQSIKDCRVGSDSSTRRRHMSCVSKQKDTSITYCFSTKLVLWMRFEFAFVVADNGLD